MPKTKNLILKCLHIIAWIIFVALCIDAGSLLVNFILSIYNPEFIQNLYQKVDLSGLYEKSGLAFFIIYGFILAIALVKTLLFYHVIKLLSKTDLSHPFSSFVARKIEVISYVTFSIGILSYIAQKIRNELGSKGYDTQSLEQFWTDSQSFILMAGIIYIIATIFKKGIEIQTENELTI